MLGVYRPLFCGVTEYDDQRLPYLPFEFLFLAVGKDRRLTCGKHAVVTTRVPHPSSQPYLIKKVASMLHQSLRLLLLI